MAKESGNEGHTCSVTCVWARRIVLAILGGTVLLAGLAMTVLPGPAFVVIPAGLAILGLEFAWARRWLHAVKARTQAAVDLFRTNSSSRRNGVNRRTPR